MRQSTHWRWHLDEVYVKINGEMRFLWRAVDHAGEETGRWISNRTENSHLPVLRSWSSS